MIFLKEAHTSKCSYFIRSVVMAKAYSNAKEKRRVYSHTVYNFILFACILRPYKKKTKQNKKPKLKQKNPKPTQGKL